MKNIDIEIEEIELDIMLRSIISDIYSRKFTKIKINFNDDLPKTRFT